MRILGIRGTGIGELSKRAVKGFFEDNMVAYAAALSWVLPDLARNNLVYAIDLPGYDGSYEPPDYSPATPHPSSARSLTR